MSIKFAAALGNSVFFLNEPAADELSAALSVLKHVDMQTVPEWQRDALERFTEKLQQLEKQELYSAMLHIELIRLARENGNEDKVREILQRPDIFINPPIELLPKIEKMQAAEKEVKHAG